VISFIKITCKPIKSGPSNGCLAAENKKPFSA
jgi:hypothetical protein